MRLATGPFWAYRPEWGVPCRITVGAPKNFDYEYDDGLRHYLAPWPPLFTMLGEEFERGYRHRLHRIGVARLRKKMAEIAARHPEHDTLTLLCFESVWKGQACHRRDFARWWEEQTGGVVAEWPPREEEGV